MPIADSSDYSSYSTIIPSADTFALHTRPEALSANAAFFQEVKDDSLRLREIVRDVRSMLDSELCSDVCVTRFTNLLRQLRDQLAVHFLLEEAFGYFEDALSVAPELTVLAKSLRQEHDTLYKEICSIVDTAKSIPIRRPQSGMFCNLLIWTRAFCDQLDQHECGEDDLIMRAYLDDLGVVD